MRPRDFNLAEVTDAAMHVFWEKGYDGTSMQDLVDRMGLSRSSLYSVFNNKHDLYREILIHYFNSETTKSINTLTNNPNILDGIEELLTSVVESEINHPIHKGCLIANTALEMGGKDPLLCEAVNEHFSRLESTLETLFTKGQTSGAILNHHAPKSMAIFVINTIQGIRVLGKGSPPEVRATRLKTVVEITMNFLRAS